MRRITFAAIDCTTGDPVCPNDAFTTSGLFANGTYQDTRLNYSGDLTQGDVSNSLLLLILTQSQTFPNPSTASGFTFRIGSLVPVRESELYGPLFGERALTNGKKQLSVSFNVNQLRFRSIDGSSIRNGERGLLWGDTNYDNDGGGYVGICRMNIDTTVAFAAATYGLLEGLDVSVAVPFVRTSVEGSNEYLDYKYQNGAFVPVDGSVFTFAPQGRYFVKGSSSGAGRHRHRWEVRLRPPARCRCGGHRAEQPGDRLARRHDGRRRVSRRRWASSARSRRAASRRT